MNKLVKTRDIFTILSLGSIWVLLEYVLGIKVTAPNIISIALSLSYLFYFFKSAMSFEMKEN